MIKLNSTIHKKLIAQAEEAKKQGLIDLAENLQAVDLQADETQEQYSYAQMQQDVQQQLWKAAAHVIKYYDLNSADAQKIDKLLSVLAEEVITDLEHNLQVSGMVKGPLEPKLLGEK